MRIPNILTNPRAIEEYVGIMRDFQRDNDTFVGVMGRYCQSGQEYFALMIASEIQNPRGSRLATLSDLTIQ